MTTPDQKVRIGFVGCGMMGQAVHLPNFLSNEQCEVVALADLRQRVGRAVASKHHIPSFYGTYEEMLNKEELDAAVMILPFHDHHRLVGSALGSGIPLYIEKPLALTASEGLELVAAADAGVAQLMVAYHKRYDPGVEKAKELVDEFRASGELGRLLSARVWNHHGDWTVEFPRRTIEHPADPMAPGPPPGTCGEPEWLRPEMRPVYYGVVGNLCHDVNLLRYLLGDPVAVSSAAIRPSEMIYNPPIAAVLDFGDFDAVFESGAVQTESWDEGARLNFERGWVELLVVPPLLRAPSQVTVRRQGKGTERVATRFGWAFEREAAHFINCVATGAAPRSPAADSAKDLAVLEALFRSAQERSAVAL